jgi:hydrogenase maturation protease
MCPMLHTLLIGYGNSLRGDDGVGYLLADQLLERFDGCEAVEIIPTMQLTPDYVARMVECNRVVFVDASVEGEVGEIRRVTLRPGVEGQIEAHSMSPQTLLNLLHALYGAEVTDRIEVLLYTITGGEFSMFEGLTDPVQRAASTLLAKLTHELEPICPDAGD